MVRERFGSFAGIVIVLWPLAVSCKSSATALWMNL